MTLVKEILKELVGMFVADARLTLALLALVAGAAAVVDYLTAPLSGGVLLVLGALAILLISVRSAAARP